MTATSPEAGAFRRRSAIPGRERWDVPAIAERPRTARALEHVLKRRPGVLHAEASADTTGVLVVFDPRVVDTPVHALISDALDESRTIDVLPVEPPKKKSSPVATTLLRILRGALPEKEKLAAPVGLSLAAHTVHTAQAVSFLGVVQAAIANIPRVATRLGATTRVGAVGWMAGISLILAGIDGLLQQKRKRAWARVANEARHRLRARLLARLQRQDVEYFDRNGTAKLSMLVTHDTSAISEFIESAADETIEKTVTLLVAGTALLRISPMLAFLTALPLLPAMLASRKIGRRASQRYAELHEQSTRFDRELESNISGIQVVKSFGGERHETRRLHAVDNEVCDATVEATAATSLQIFTAQGLMTAGFSVTVGYGGWMVAMSKMTADAFVSATYWFRPLISALTGIENIVRVYHAANDSALRLNEALVSRPRIRSGPVRVRPNDVRGEIVFDDVTFAYDEGTPVLENVSLAVKPGETLAIVGPTGSGKSTLLKLLARFYDVDGGRILLDGHDLRQLDLRALRALISLVSQDVYLFHGSVGNNVRFGRAGADETEVRDVLEQIGSRDITALPGGLDAPVGEHGRRLSGGQRQRVAIARAMLKRAPILALDEATSHLDNEAEAAVRRSLKTSGAGRTTIVVAHRLSTIRHADRIAVLDKGRIVEEGTHDELVSRSGLYSWLWQLQSGDKGLEVRVASNGE